jgi:GntR family transcriptional regulator, transcriptional repressor for pyruvate dehydrogenase complex
MDEPMSNCKFPEFKTIRRRTLSGEVVEQILSLIHSNQLQPGDRLPPERELCRAFNVGRSSVREAIKILETTGLVHATKRDKEISIPRATKVPEFNFAADRTNIREVFEARKAIEIELSGFAAQRATSEEIATMRQALISEGATRSVLAAGDIAFHRALVRSAHNSVLSEVYNAITGLLFQHFKYYPLSWVNNKEDPKEFVLRVNKNHLAIIEAIEAHDVARAKLAMQVHLDRAEAGLLASLDEQYLATNDVAGRDVNQPLPNASQVESQNQNTTEGSSTSRSKIQAQGELHT